VKSHHPTRANTPQPNELEYLDVFDLFNFPRMLVPGVDVLGGTGNGHSHNTNPEDQAPDMSDIGGMNPANMIPNFAVPNPEADWLYHSV
jgi:hypothetical protein